MITNLNFADSYALLKSIHTLISGSFLVIAIWLTIRSVKGIFKGTTYSKTDKWLSYGFIITMYLQLILGLILFANPNVGAETIYPGVEGALRHASKRFWPIEHIVLMLFALFIANLGLIFSNHTADDKGKYSKILIYYLIAMVMIGLSLSNT